MTANTRRLPVLERGLAIAAIVAGGLAVVAGTPTRSTGTIDVQQLALTVEREEDHVTAVELAKWIRDDKSGLRVLDIRSDSEFNEFHIPGATRAPLSEIARMPLDSAATYVLYSEGGTHAAQGWFLLRARGARNAFFLRGGLYEWLDGIMNPRLLASTPQVERDSVRALTMWFGGKLEIVQDSTPSVIDRALPVPGARSTGSDVGAAIKKVRRRAC